MDIKYGALLNFIIINLFLVYGQRTKDKMYENIIGANGCYRRLNSTHQIGCSSKRGGSTGVIHYCEDAKALDFILRQGIAGPYIPVIPTKLFTVETVDKLVNSQKISGLVLHPNETLSYFTHENQCPNPQSSLEKTCSPNSPWNPYGTSLLYRDIPFPIFYVESEVEVKKMIDCFEQFNNFQYENQGDRSLCSLELRSFMFAAVNSQTCRRRSNIVTNLNPVTFCDPLGDNNVWAALHPLVKGPRRNETEPLRDFKYIVVAARMDTTSMFEKTSGANSPVTGIVSLLYTAKLLKSILSEADMEAAKMNVLFILFNGETFDYIGSQRLVYDMQNGNFPVKGLGEDNDILPVIKPENVSLFVELSQLGNSRNKELFVHSWKSSEEVGGFYNKLKYYGDLISFKNVSASVPPASLHSFLKNNLDFPGLIVTDHEDSYTNTFYNSIYDNSSNIAYKYYNATESQSEIPVDSIQQFIANLSGIVAKSVYEEIKGNRYTGSLSLDVSLVDELFHCYLENPNCKVHSATQKGKLPTVPSSLYVGVDRVTNYASTFSSLALGWFTGTDEGEANINCTNQPRNYAFHYYNMSKSIQELNVTRCFKITMNLTEAKSPAFLIDDYDWSSGRYSSWTESIWLDMGVRMFLKPSAAHEKMTIAIGSMSLIFSFIAVYFLKTRSHILFTPPIPAEAPADC